MQEISLYNTAILEQAQVREAAPVMLLDMQLASIRPPMRMPWNPAEGHQHISQITRWSDI